MASGEPDPSLAALQAEHTREAIEYRLQRGPQHSYLKDFIYGAIDGTVTTFAIVAGVAGARLAATVVLVLGVANLIADGFSMAVSNYLGTRAEQQERLRLRRIEEQHIAQYPKGEREEIRQIFQAKGFEGPELERVVDVITSDTQRWVDTMLTDELGVPLAGANPLRAAGSTFLAFVLVGSLPLVAFVYQTVAPPQARLSHPFMWSAVMTGGAFFVVGVLKGRIVGGRSWLSGLQTLLIGGIAAALAYAVGYILHELLGPTE